MYKGKDFYINSKRMPYPIDFTLSKEGVFINEAQTMSGTTINDCIGYKFSDTTLNWDALPASYLQILADIKYDTFEIAIDDFEGGHTFITAIKKSLQAKLTPYTDANGEAIWSNVSLSVSFPECIRN